MAYRLNRRIYFQSGLIKTKIKDTIIKQLCRADIENLINIINTQSKNIIAQGQKKYNKKSIQESLEFIRNRDIRELLGIKANLKENFDCIIFAGNKAYIDKDARGIYRYFSFTPYNPNKDCINTIVFRDYYFNVIDIFLLLFTDENFYEVVTKLEDIYGVNCNERRYITKMSGKYAKNIKTIKASQLKLLREYPDFYILAENTLVIYQELCCQGIAHLNRYNHADLDKNDIFFTSIYYIENFTDYKKTKIANSINLLACLGLIEKVKESEIPHEMLQKSKQRQRENSYGKTITYYRVPALAKSILQTANERAKTLLENRINSTVITKDKISKVLGEEIAKNVFQQTNNLHIKNETEI